MSFVALAGTIGAGATALLGGMGMATGVGTLGAALGTGIGAVGAGAIGGAGLGALGSAITGGDVGKGAMFGALGGGLTGGLSSAIGSIGGAAGSGGGAAVGSGGGAAAGGGGGGAAAGGAGSSLAGVAPGGGAFVGPQVPVNLVTSQTGGIAPGSVINAMGGAGNIPAGAVPASSGIGAVGNTVVAPTGLPAATMFGQTVPTYAGTLFQQYGVPIVGAGAMLGNYLGGDSGPTQATPPSQEWNPLSFYKFNPRKFQPTLPTYAPYEVRYANGGIASLTSPDPAMMQSGPARVDFMGQDAYPTSQQKLNFYASPTQMPTSAQQAMASYEPSTNPLTGEPLAHFASGGISDLGAYSDGGRLTRGPGDGVSDDIPATIAGKRPARLADGEFVVPARAVSELGNGSTNAGAKRLYDMVDRIQNKRKKSMGRKNIAVDSKARAALPV